MTTSFHNSVKRNDSDISSGRIFFPAFPKRLRNTEKEHCNKVRRYNNQARIYDGGVEHLTHISDDLHEEEARLCTGRKSSQQKKNDRPDKPHRHSHLTIANDVGVAFFQLRTRSLSRHIDGFLFPYQHFF